MLKHDDFTTLELDDVLVKIMTFVQQRTGCATVHWASGYGLLRVVESPEEQWRWAFATADVTGHHMWSVPATDTFSSFQLWRQVGTLLPQPWKAGMGPHTLQSPLPRFVLPVSYGDKFLGVLVLDSPKDMNPVHLMVQIQAGLEIATRYLHFAYVHLAALNESYLDELTGLYNQRYLPMALEHEINRAKRDKTKFTLLFLDIDYFKMVNDGRGHWVGSRLLVELGKVLRAQVRSCDYCFRYGGDEFIVLLSGAAAEEAVKVAERIRQSVERNSFTVEGHNLNLTVSIGLASYPQHAQTAPGLIQIADQAMYYGKRKSRNIVFVAS
jgi:diguanylate cyclase (GGDEF)-like protein